MTGIWGSCRLLVMGSWCRTVAIGSWEVCDPPQPFSHPFFMPHNLQKVANLVSTLSPTQCDPPTPLPLKNPGYALAKESRSSFTEFLEFLAQFHWPRARLFNVNG